MDSHPKQVPTFCLAVRCMDYLYFYVAILFQLLNNVSDP